MLERARHEEIINSLNNPELSHTERTTLLEELRQGHNEGLDTIANHTERITKLDEENRDLVQANSKFFRERGYVPEDNGKLEEEDELKNMTVDDILGGK